jgi:hypothetical protein
MGFKTETPKEAYFHVQKERLEHIKQISLMLGVDLQEHHPWFQDENHPHEWYKKEPHGVRDRLVYPGIAVVSQRTLPDSKVNTLEEKADFATVQDCYNGTEPDGELTFTVDYTKQTSVSEGTEKKSSVGWSFESATEVGVEESGVSFKETVTVGAHGEEEKLRSLTTGDDDAVHTSIVVNVPYGKTYRVQQFENKSRIEVVSRELMYFDIAFEIYGHTNLYRHRLAGDALKDNHRMKRFRGTKHSYAMLTVRNEKDFHEILVGVSDDYPHQRQNLLNNSHIRTAYEALIDKDKWSFEVVNTTPFDKGISGHVQVIDTANKEVLKTEH